MLFAMGTRSFFPRRMNFNRVVHLTRTPAATALLLRRSFVTSSFNLKKSFRFSSSFIRRAAEQDSEGSMSGEWPMAWSLASYEDISEYYGDKLMKEEGMGGYLLEDIMTKDLILTAPTTTRKELEHLFKEHTGLPVVDAEGRLLGVVSRSDLNRPGDLVQDLMSSPPIAAKPTARVADAACLMLKHKVHRIPIVEKTAKVVGFVTRTDIFEALEAETEISEGIPK